MAGSEKPQIRQASKTELARFYRRAVETVMQFQIRPALFEAGLACDECFVADLAGGTVGAVTLNFAKSGDPELATLYVLPQHGFSGIGTMLAEVAMRRLCELFPAKMVYCDVTTEAMDRTIKKLPPDLQARVKSDRTYERYGENAFPDEHLRIVRLNRARVNRPAWL
jgi:hypothetical protein